MRFWILDFRIWLVVGVGASLLSAFAAEPPSDDIALPFRAQVFGWSYARERKTVVSSNRVVASFSIKNLSEAPLDDVNVSLTFTTALGEKLGAPVSQALGTLASGEVRKVSLTGDFVPAFQGYQLLVAYAGGKPEEWFGNSDISPPQPKSIEPIVGSASLIVLGQEIITDKFGRFGGVVRVQNEGTVAAKNVKVFITFYDAKRTKLLDWSGPLGKGTIEGGALVNLTFAVSNAPRRYNSYDLRVAHDKAPEGAFIGGDFANVEDVEFARFRFNRTGAKGTTLKVDAQARNGLALAVDQVKLTLVFFGQAHKEVKRFAYDLPGELKPNEIKAAAFSIPDLPAYSEFEQVITYRKIEAAGAQAEPGGAKFQNVPDVEVIFTDAVVEKDNAVTLVGALRNGRAAPVKDVTIHITFQKADGTVIKDVEKTLKDVIQPGAERNFVVKADGAAGFVSYPYTFKFVELGAEAPRPAPDRGKAQGE